MHRLLVAAFLPVCAFAQANNIANYDLTARLDPGKKTVEGHETLRWTNISMEQIGELQFHLYMNAFRNEKSTFMKESGGQLRGDRSRKDSWGWIDVKSMRISGNGADLTKSMQFIAPDDGNAEDRTVIRVPLPKPLGPGQEITLDIDFHTRLPHVFARTGYHGDFFLVGQWFPKIGVFETPGMRYATKAQWNCHQFHANTEFYADFGRYTAKLSVPSNYVVGATGEGLPISHTERETTYLFMQYNVHDFAWTAQPAFRRHERMFRATEWVSDKELDSTAKRFGISRDDARLSDVKMILLLQPEHDSQADRHFRAVANAIKYFGLWYGRYPHRTITVVDPPHGAGGASGMEYPTFITAGTRWIGAPNDGVPEEVVVHEFGHQFWQGLVATNEFEDAWMDEGFNTYSTGKVMDLAYGARNLPITIMGIPLHLFMTVPTIRTDAIDRTGHLIWPKADNLARMGWQYQNSESYGLNSYMRTGLMLRTLENLLGEETMARVMRAYQQRWRWNHPAASDFFRMVNEVSGRDMTWYFDQFVNGSNVLDYRIAEASTQPVHTAIGEFNGKTVTAKDARKIDRDLEKAKKQMYETKVTVRREGEATAPVDIRFDFEKGVVERRQWDGQYRWIKYTFTKPQKLTQVQLDPDRKMLLDVNFTNNSRTLDKKHLGTSVKWSSTLLFWVQWMMAAVSSMA
jgi:Peptidase family M1 domain